MQHDSSKKKKKNMQHASKFKLIDTTTYLFLSISSNKITKHASKFQNFKFYSN